MSDSRLPKIGETVKEIGKIIAVFNGYVEVQGFNSAIAYIRVPTHHLKWNEKAALWEVS